MSPREPREVSRSSFGGSGQGSVEPYLFYYYIFLLALMSVNEVSAELNQGYTLVTTDEGIGLLWKRNSILKPHYSKHAAP